MSWVCVESCYLVLIFSSWLYKNLFLQICSASSFMLSLNHFREDCDMFYYINFKYCFVTYHVCFFYFFFYLQMWGLKWHFAIRTLLEHFTKSVKKWNRKHALSKRRLAQTTRIEQVQKTKTIDLLRTKQRWQMRRRPPYIGSQGGGGGGWKSVTDTPKCGAVTFVQLMSV